jgi:hypothetical protein
MNRILLTFILVTAWFWPCDAQFVQHRRKAFQSGASTPSFVAERGRGSALTSNAATNTQQPTGDMAAGNRAVLFVGWSAGATQNVSSITDTDGNTWTLDATLTDFPRWRVYSAPLGATLSTADTITINWSGAEYTHQWWVLFELENVTGVDVTAATGSYGTDASSVQSTTSANTVIIGVSERNDATNGITSLSWTTIGTAPEVVDVYRSYYYYSEETTAGSKDNGGTLNTADDWTTIWVAYD